MFKNLVKKHLFIYRENSEQSRVASFLRGLFLYFVRFEIKSIYKALLCNDRAILCLQANSGAKHDNEIIPKDFSDIEHKEKVIDFQSKLFNSFAHLSWA